MPPWVSQLIFPWVICVATAAALIYYGMWPQALIVAIVGVVGTVLTRHRHRAPIVTTPRSMQYSSTRSLTSVSLDNDRPLIGLTRDAEKTQYVWLIPDVGDGDWGYALSRADAKRRTRPVVSIVSKGEIDRLSRIWRLRLLPQDEYSDEVYRIHFGRFSFAEIID